jgi:hypothetical protein
LRYVPKPQTRYSRFDDWMAAWRSRHRHQLRLARAIGGFAAWGFLLGFTGLLAVGGGAHWPAVVVGLITVIALVAALMAALGHGERGE